MIHVLAIIGFVAMGISYLALAIIATHSTWKYQQHLGNDGFGGVVVSYSVLLVMIYGALSIMEQFAPYLIGS